MLRPIGRIPSVRWTRTTVTQGIACCLEATGFLQVRRDAMSGHVRGRVRRDPAQVLRRYSSATGTRHAVHLSRAFATICRSFLIGTLGLLALSATPAIA